MGAASAATLGGEPVAGAIGAVIGEIIGETYREGGFGNQALDQNSADYQERVEYGVAFAKMAAVMAVGIMGGDVEAAAFTADNAARYNSFMSVGNYADRRALEENEQNAQTDEECEFLAALIAQTYRHPLEQGLETGHAFAAHPLPEGVLRYINPINARTQAMIDERERVFQSYDKVSPVLGVALRLHDWKTTVGLHMAELPTTCGGALMTVLPVVGELKIGATAVVNTVKSSVKSVASLVSKELAVLRGVGSNASRLGSKPLSLKASNSNQLPTVKPTALQSNTEIVHSDFWNKRTYFKGNRVYQRDDLIDPTRMDASGKTNLDRMKVGHAPIGPDNKPIELHHMLQTPDGAIAEVTYDFHKSNKKAIHINPSSIPSGIHRPTHDKWRISYWKDRANDF